MGELAEGKEIEPELSIYGGCAIMLAFDRSAITRDIDAVFHPSHIARPLISQVATEMKLPEEWLNDDVRQFLAPKGSMRELPLPSVNSTSSPSLKKSSNCAVAGPASALPRKKLKLASVTAAIANACNTSRQSDVRKFKGSTTVKTEGQRNCRHCNHRLGAGERRCPACKHGHGRWQECMALLIGLGVIGLVAYLQLREDGSASPLWVTPFTEEGASPAQIKSTPAQENIVRESIGEPAPAQTHSSPR